MSEEKKKKKVKARQPDFPVEGMAAKKIEEVEECALRYVDARDDRLAAQIPEKKEKTLLMALMKKHGVTLYKFDNKLVELVSKDETVKVRDVDDPENVKVEEEE